MRLSDTTYDRIQFFIRGLAHMGTLKADHRVAHDEAVSIAQMLDAEEKAQAEGDPE